MHISQKSCTFAQKSEFMKKLLIIAFCAFSLSACADDSKIISFDLLPDNAKTLLQQYVDVQQIIAVTQEGRSAWAEYDVLLSDRSQWDFDNKGALESVRVLAGVPNELVPTPIQTTVTKMYPDALIIKYSIDKSDREQEVELNNRIELTFDLSGALKEVDVD